MKFKTTFKLWVYHMDLQDDVFNVFVPTYYLKF